MSTYDQLTDKQREQVAAQFSGDTFLGNDPAGYEYEIGISGMVLCRRRIQRTNLFAQDDQAAMYRLAKEQGDKRFGSACRHERVRNGHCTNCLRAVVTP